MALSLDRTLRSLEPSDGGIGVDADDQQIAAASRSFQVRHMSRVEQIEATVREDDFLFHAACPIAQPRGRLGREDLGFRSELFRHGLSVTR